MNSVLLDIIVKGRGFHIPRYPSLILGDGKKYLQGDILDANAVTAEIDKAIGDVVDTAPEALDTLKEIAESLHNDSDLAGTLISQLNALEERLDNNNNDQQTALDTAVQTIESALDLKADLVDGVIPYS